MIKNPEWIQHMIYGLEPESMKFQDIKEIVIPALRNNLKELVEKDSDQFFYINQSSNHESKNIIERAKAICGNLEEMTGYELNKAVKILRKECYLVKLEVYKDIEE